MSDTNSRYVVLLLVLLITLFSSFLGARTVEPSTVRIAGIILKWAPKDKSTNFEHADLLIREAASKGAEIGESQYQRDNKSLECFFHLHYFGTPRIYQSKPDLNKNAV